jgi:Tfp pilus assembly protein PilO
MFEKLPFYVQVLIFVALGVGLVGMSYYVWPNLADMRQQIDKYAEDFAEKDRKILEGRAIEQRLPEFEREIAALEQKLGDVQQILPTGQETGDLLAWIKAVGDQSNLDLKSFSPAGLKPVDFYKEFPIDMDVVGRYHDLGIFLDRVSKYSRIINVDDLKISAVRTEKDKTIRATFKATLVAMVALAAPAFPQEPVERTDESGEAPSTAPGSVVEAPSAEPPMAATVDRILREQEQVLRGQMFSYDPSGRRDPFQSLLTPRIIEGERPTGVGGMLVTELDLAGVIQDRDGGDLAMVIGSDNKGYFLRIGDAVFDGTLITIDPDSGAVTFRQEVDDPRLIKPYRDVVKRLVPEEGSSNE